MVDFKKINQSVQDERALEQVVADSKKLQADVLYLSMMTDVELYDDSEEEEEA